MDFTRDGRPKPPSTAALRYPGRACHWIRPNSQERIPHRHIVADTESDRLPLADGEQLRFHCAAAARWRDDLPSGDHLERGYWTSPRQFWEWVLDYCWSHGRTVLWFHNAGHDLGQLDAFRILPALGCELRWCNLSRDVSVVTWATPRGTLVIADTLTWVNVPLEDCAPLTGMAKTPLPRRGDPEPAWRARCEADVEITRRVVAQLLAFIAAEHLGNWQPSGAGMGHTAWRHRFMTDKVLVHDDAGALAAEREAMHAGRAEAWHHGRAAGGPFTEWDMHMSYCRIAAECLVPAKLWAHDPRPSRRVHEWALEHWRVLARVTVTTDQPVVPCQHDGRTLWPTGTFDTTLWDSELQLITDAGGTYTVHEQWRYTRKPALKAWAEWSLACCGLPGDRLDPVARLWVKHQSRAVIGRLALRTPSWEEWGENYLPGHAGISLVTDSSGVTRRQMHVGSKVLEETDRAEASNSVPQVTSWIMAEARARLWRATLAAGQEHVLHVDTDAVITDAEGSSGLERAITGGLPGAWRSKERWRSLEITGPRHYQAPGRRQVPGVPRRAVQTAPGTYEGEIWDSLARTLTEAPGAAGRIRLRTWHPQRIDHRRPWTGDGPHRALPVRLPAQEETRDGTEPSGAAGGDRPGRVDRRGHPGRDRGDHQRRGGPDRGGEGRGEALARPDRRGTGRVRAQR